MAANAVSLINEAHLEMRTTSLCLRGFSRVRKKCLRGRSTPLAGRKSFLSRYPSHERIKEFEERMKENNVPLWQRPEPKKTTTSQHETWVSKKAKGDKQAFHLAHKGKTTLPLTDHPTMSRTSFHPFFLRAPKSPRPTTGKTTI
jgi:hypothetical protein